MSIQPEHSSIKTDNLSIGYFSKKKISPIYADLNLDLKKGEFVCLLGENGIGKSTLLRTLSKVQPPIKGAIYIHSKNLHDFESSELATAMSLVLTEKLPESNLSVFELISLGRQPYTNWIGNLTEFDVLKINEAMEMTNISHLSQKKYFELSDGQLQKVLISRALAQDTDIIILDEPTAHLDVRHKMETFELLKNLSEELTKTIIVSTHEIHSAIQTAHQLWLMTKNEFITGSPQQLIESNSIEKLFDSENIRFDPAQNQFRFN